MCKELNFINKDNLLLADLTVDRDFVILNGSKFRVALKQHQELDLISIISNLGFLTIYLINFCWNTNYLLPKWSEKLKEVIFSNQQFHFLLVNYIPDSRKQIIFSGDYLDIVNVLILQDHLSDMDHLGIYYTNTTIQFIC